MQKITPFLWFNHNAEEAVNFYISVFQYSKITSTTYNPESGPDPVGEILTIGFQLEHQDFTAINGGPTFQFTPAISLFVDCENQAEVDTLWNNLTTGGGSSQQCGWVRDRFEVSWQVVPRILITMLQDPDQTKAARVMQAMMKMDKIIINDLEQAYDRP